MSTENTKINSWICSRKKAEKITNSSYPKAVTASEIKEIDRRTIQDYKIPALTLMENAGKAVANVVLGTLRELGLEKVAIICGRGNNGGDGLVAARYLIKNKIDAAVFLVGRIDKSTPEFLTNLDSFKKLTSDIKEIIDKENFTKLKHRIATYHLFIDALFGVGLKGNLKPPYDLIIDFLNKTKKLIVSVDLPSGLDATTGEVLRAAVKATKTVTFALPKTGFFKKQGPEHTGEIIVADIGIPKELIESVGNK